MCEATKLTEEKEEEKIYCMVAVHSFGLIKKKPQRSISRSFLVLMFL
jgi:hypothetical protein